MNRTLVAETCCEEINVNIFLKLQLCLEEVRETERTLLNSSAINLEREYGAYEREEAESDQTHLSQVQLDTKAKIRRGRNQFFGELWIDRFLPNQNLA